MTENLSAGWHPDPTATHQVRYHDGSGWTAHVSDDGRQSTSPMPGGPPPGMPPAPPAGSPAKTKKKRATWKWVAGGFVVLMLIVAAAGGGSSEDADEGGTSATTASGAGASDPDAADAQPAGKDDGCGTRATSDCTPHLGTDGVVRVDALLWRVRSVSVRDEIGDRTYGLGAKADGRFVVVKVAVQSDRDESVTLTDNTIKLEVDGNTYDADLDGTVAATTSDGDDPFFLESLDPDSKTTGTVVFDVPASVLTKKLEVRFNELGFGDGHGYIRLPSLAGR